MSPTAPASCAVRALDSAEVLAVACDHDLAANVDSHFVEFAKILGASVVGVDDFGLNLTGG